MRRKNPAFSGDNVPTAASRLLDTWAANERWLFRFGIGQKASFPLLTGTMRHNAPAIGLFAMPFYATVPGRFFTF